MISQKELAKMLLHNGWKCITYTYDTSRHDLEYSEVEEDVFDEWWCNKGNKVWFKCDRSDHISIKFDYGRIQIWLENSNPITYENAIPMEEAARLIS